MRDTLQMLRMTMPNPMWALAAAAAWWNERGVDCHKTNSLLHSKSTRCDSVLAVGNGSGGGSGGRSHLSLGHLSFFLSFLPRLWCTFLLAKGSSCGSSCGSSNSNFTLAPTTNSSHFHCACLPAVSTKYIAEPSNCNNNSSRCTVFPFLSPNSTLKKRKAHTSALDQSLHNTFACPVSAHRTKPSAQYLEMCVCVCVCMPMACASSSSIRS